MTDPIVVVGSGIVGSAIAWQMQDRGTQTLLVERDFRPHGPSFASFASLTALDETVREVYGLKCLGMSHWRRWQRELGDDIGLQWNGEIRWAETKQSALSLQTMIDRSTYRGYPVRRLSKSELIDLLPSSQPAEVFAASYVSDDGQADPPKAIAALRDRFQRSGGAVLTGQVTLRFDDKSTYVRVGTDEVKANTVVVATGAETHTFLENLGWDIPMDPSPGLLVVTKPLERLLNGTAYVYPSLGVSIHLRQLEDGRVLIGEHSQDYAAEKPTQAHAKDLLQQAARSFPRLASAEVDHFTVEWRPMPRDGMPIMGPLPGLPSVYVATAHSGVTLAPAVAGIVAQELIDGLPARQFENFRPARFANRQLDIADQVEEVFRGPSELFLG